MARGKEEKKSGREMEMGEKRGNRKKSSEGWG